MLTQLFSKKNFYKKYSVYSTIIDLKIIDIKIFLKQNTPNVQGFCFTKTWSKNSFLTYIYINKIMKIKDV